MDIAIFTPEGLEPDPASVQQIETVAEDDRVVDAALMADHHKGYSMPIGGVAAYKDAISPSGVGYDIACGNMAVQTNIRIKDLLNADEDCPDHLMPSMTPEEFNEYIKPIMRQIQKKVEFGVGGSRSRSAGWVDHDLFDDPVWSEVEHLFGASLKQKAREQLGTVGSGNHYVDLLVDAEGWVWVANHFGSRGLGWTIGNGFMAHAQGRGWKERAQEGDGVAPCVFDTNSEAGALYIAMMQLAGSYAYAGREAVMRDVLEILGAETQAVVHNHHNYAFYDKRDGNWLVAKGATPLTGDPAFIGGSMGDMSVIVRGRLLSDMYPGKYEHLTQNVQDIGALGFAPHGSGRVMSRTAAAGKVRKMWSCTNRDCNYMVRAEPGSIPKENYPQHCGKRMAKVRTRDASSAAIDWDATRADLLARGITVLGAGADEAPGVYKPLADVINAHENIVVLNILRPIGVVMAGADTFDPYKD